MLQLQVLSVDRSPFCGDSLHRGRCVRHRRAQARELSRLAMLFGELCMVLLRTLAAVP